MAHPDHFRLAPDERQAREAAEHLFEKVRDTLQPLLPDSAEVLHIGATAVPGCLTKGDLDIVVRVSRRDFAAADAVLVACLQRNVSSIMTDDFAAFEDEARTPHLGIQLTVKGGPYDGFHRFAAALRSDALLLGRYNALKRIYDGRTMEEYRPAKDAFVAQVLLQPPLPDDGNAA